ncbi:hypothetical protein I7I50_07658 [Histoplasma capsulatum G186AR]|uniref:Uncharacterized protein n=1 Tax=Ajellomyces capsulatus TaxID=5037 RepID=A0A8H7Z0T3_AJECA|nr:hypothetical protein I7I52_09271 [Histoplasma capsulatum]QSS68298.1 hypothetical protein I7I50_07658 [Histoplasma capsulatum G186AR]
MEALYGNEFAFRSHTAQEQSCLPPDVHPNMILTQSTTHWGSQPPQQPQQQEGLFPTYSPNSHHDQHQEQYQLGNQLCYYQNFQLEQQQQRQQEQEQQQFPYQSCPYQYQHHQPPNRLKSNRQGDPRARLALPRLDTSSPAVRPRTQTIKRPRYYANFQMSTPVTTSVSSTTSTPLSPSATSQVISKGPQRRASFSLFPEADSASTGSSNPRRPASSAAATALISAPCPSSSPGFVFPNPMKNQIDNVPCSTKAMKSRTLFGGVVSIVSSSRKERRLVKKQKSIPNLPDASPVVHPKKELKRSRSLFGLLWKLVGREK